MNRGLCMTRALKKAAYIRRETTRINGIAACLRLTQDENLHCARASFSRARATELAQFRDCNKNQHKKRSIRHE